ncbi:MAG: hypothetical protein NT157_06220, partial [Candidatus Micrarchaeota archaeon]|nr:hypothetical protein [Candidatus Micrarchaeota archaeon]
LFSGVKETRYLNVLVPSQALFLAKKTSEQPRPKGRRVATAPRLFSETKTKIFAALLVVGLLAISLNASFDYARAGAQKEYIIPNDEKMRECRVMSDQWIRFYDKGIVAEPLPREDDFGYFLKTGASLVIYEKNISMEKSLDYDAIIGKNYLFLRPNKCAQQPTSFVLKVWRGDWNIKK